MKFDFVIGNPPYQEEVIGENKTYAPPVYNKFMDAAYSVSDKVELIHPARFLFNAGSTPKAWNEQMLADEHFKVLHYEEDSSKIFRNTEIKGGLAITYRDATQTYGNIGIFTPYPALNSLLHKVRISDNFTSFSAIVVSSYSYHFTDKLYEDIPEAFGCQSTGHEYDLKTNVFSKMPHPFYNNHPNNEYDYIQILGRENNERVFKYIRRDYINSPVNLDTYKLFLPSANGNGLLGEALAAPILCGPAIGSTETFIGIGSFKTEAEAKAALKYIQTKFVRILLGVLKKTQHITPDKWTWVPLQDFTSASDIDWSVSVADIDKQLYKKYGLTDEEILFIESTAKGVE